jgi:hypothetical protein
MKTNKQEETKEDFCGACALAIPAALGVSGAAASSGGDKSNTKTIILWTSVGITVLSIALFIYFKTRCKSCR